MGTFYMRQLKQIIKNVVDLIIYFRNEFQVLIYIYFLFN